MKNALNFLQPVMPTTLELDTDEEEKKKEDIFVDQAGEGDTVLMQESHRGDSPPGSSAMGHGKARRS